MLEGRIGKEDAQPGNPRRYGVGDGAAIAAARENDGTGGSREQQLFLGGQRADCSRGIKIAHHHRQRLSVAALALAQAHYRGLAGCIDAEVKAADAFDGDDFAGEEEVDGLVDWIILLGG